MEYDIRELTLAEVDKLYEFLMKVKDEGQAPYYSISEIEYYQSRVEDYGRIFGAFRDEDLVAYAILDFVGVGQDNYGYMNGIPNNELLRVALNAGCVVSPRHRGKGLQRMLCEVRDTCARDFGCLHLFASTHSENMISRNNLLNSGFELIVHNKDLGWGVRDILYKSLRSQ